MKIVEVINIPWWNASAEYCITIADALSKRGHSVTVMCEDNTPSYKKAVECNLSVDTMLSFKSLYFLNDILNIKNAFRTMYNDVRIVNVHTAHAQSLFITAKILFNLRFKIVRTRVDLRKIKRYPLNRFSYRSLNGIIVANQSDHSEVLSFTKMPLHKVKIIYAGVDLQRFKPLLHKKEIRRRFNIPENALVVGNIARHSPVKGHDVFFKSAQVIHSEVKNVFFVTAGVDDTVSLESLKKMAVQAGVLEKTLFLNYVDNVEELIGCLDIGVVSSIGSENHSRITLEYMACNIPVVGSDVGDIGELIAHEKTGFVVGSGNFIAFADVVMKLLKDRELREVFSYNSRRLVEQQFSINSFAESTELFYAEVASWKKQK